MHLKQAEYQRTFIFLRPFWRPSLWQKLLLRTLTIEMVSNFEKVDKNCFKFTFNSHFDHGDANDLGATYTYTGVTCVENSVEIKLHSLVKIVFAT